jgi:hypothetical protein
MLAQTPGDARAPLVRGSVAAVMPSFDDVPPAALVTEVLEHVGSLVLVDDGSDAATARELDALATADRVELVRMARRTGKGSAIRAGVDRVLARPEPPLAVLLLDADGQHPPGAIPAFLTAAVAADVVVGDRFDDLASMPLARKAANVATQRLFRLATGCDVRDTQNGMRLLRTAALASLEPGGFEAETRHLKRVLLDGLAVAWTPVPAIYAGERSSFRTCRDGLRVLWAVVRPAAPATRSPARSPRPAPSRRPRPWRSASRGTPATAPPEPRARAAEL